MNLITACLHRKEVTVLNVIACLPLFFIETMLTWGLKNKNIHVVNGTFRFLYFILKIFSL